MLFNDTSAQFGPFSVQKKCERGYQGQVWGVTAVLKKLLSR